jgi:allantoinase
VLHLSAASALPLIAEAKAEGLRVTAETCPHYLVFDEEHIPAGATQYKCCPPIRDAANQDALWQGLADGVLDFVVSDHSPSTAERKFAGDGDFQVAWGGVSGLQFGLPAVWTEARRRGVPLERVAGWFTSATADFAGLRGKGRIAVGGDADFAVFAPEEPHRVEVGSLRYRNPVSAYVGAELTGVIRSTYLAGRPIDAAGAPAGRLLSRA